MENGENGGTTKCSKTKLQHIMWSNRYTKCKVDLSFVFLAYVMIGLFVKSVVVIKVLPSICPIFKFLNIGELMPKKYFDNGIRVK